ncbi:MAG TPA: Txe/YoeB family addiction module toxin, partial [Rhodanobacter sp.]|nr:Txe/YoeB family addiction module toxin [Rhodanobacter sp.]
YWQSQDRKTLERKTLERINTLLNACQRDLFKGIGKPEPLRAELSGYWSRRIDDTHRLVYRVAGHELQIVACRYHYGAR